MASHMSVHKPKNYSSVKWIIITQHIIDRTQSMNSKYSTGRNNKDNTKV